MNALIQKHAIAFIARFGSDDEEVFILLSTLLTACRILADDGYTAVVEDEWFPNQDCLRLPEVSAPKPVVAFLEAIFSLYTILLADGDRPLRSASATVKQNIYSAAVVLTMRNGAMHRLLTLVILRGYEPSKDSDVQYREFIRTNMAERIALTSSQLRRGTPPTLRNVVDIILFHTLTLDTVYMHEM